MFKHLLGFQEFSEFSDFEEILEFYDVLKSVFSPEFSMLGSVGNFRILKTWEFQEYEQLKNIKDVPEHSSLWHNLGDCRNPRGKCESGGFYQFWWVKVVWCVSESWAFRKIGLLRILKMLGISRILDLLKSEWVFSNLKPLTQFQESRTFGNFENLRRRLNFLNVENSLFLLGMFTFGGAFQILTSWAFGKEFRKFEKYEC